MKKITKIIVTVCVFVLTSCTVPEVQVEEVLKTQVEVGITETIQVSMPTSETTVTTTEAFLIDEVEILEIPLPSPLDKANAEISGMTWFGDKLVLLPQYPERFKEAGISQIFYINKADIFAFLESPSSTPIRITPVQFIDDAIRNAVAGFEGYEAIAFFEDKVFVTIESKPTSEMMGYLVSGDVLGDLSAINLETGNMVELAPPADNPNASDEALFIFEGIIHTIFEDNGKLENPNPVVRRFDLSLNQLAPLSFPQIEFRVTDASEVDDEGHLWVMNYYYPGDTHLQAQADPIAERFGEGRTHLTYEPVERLLRLQLKADAVELVDSEPIYFQLLEDDEARNWEGLVALDEIGFLVATDKFPGTILGFCEILR